MFGVGKYFQIGYIILKAFHYHQIDVFQCKSISSAACRLFDIEIGKFDSDFFVRAGHQRPPTSDVARIVGRIIRRHDHLKFNGKHNG
jgi:hypothetical protein